ncbi:MAG: zf-HC2 domain-containing protein [Planctomycetota bacterium]
MKQEPSPQDPRDLFVAYLDGELSDDERQRVDQHLADHPQDRDLLEEHRRVGELLDSRFATNERASSKEGSSLATTIRFRAAQERRRRWVSVAAAAALVLTTGLIWQSLGGSTNAEDKYVIENLEALEAIHQEGGDALELVQALLDEEEGGSPLDPELFDILLEEEMAADESEETES